MAPIDMACAATDDAFSGMLDGLGTGDVLIYRTRDLGARFNSCVLRSRWSHVGLVVKMPREAAAPMYQKDYAASMSTGGREELHVFEACPRRGVALFPLEPRLARTIGSIKWLAVRKLTYGRPTFMSSAKTS